VRRLELPDLTLAYEDTGEDGPTVVFVHGLGGAAYGWWAQLAACRERGYRAIAYDQRGAGLSSRLPGPYSVELWAQDLERLLDGLEVERAALVGHSVGCMVAEHAALELGERVWALALCGGRLAWPEEGRPVFEQRAALARQGRMDEIAEAVAASGISEAGRRRDPALYGLMLRMVAASDPASYAEAALATGRAEMRHPSRGGRGDRRRRPGRRGCGHRGRCPLVHARAPRGVQRGPDRVPRAASAGVGRKPVNSLPRAVIRVQKSAPAASADLAIGRSWSTIRRPVGAETPLGGCPSRPQQNLSFPPTQD
jgi:3-oxoadipate enol-lactonase